MTNKSGRTFILRLRSLRPDDRSTMRSLRLLLKGILRRHEFRCVSVEEVDNA